MNEILRILEVYEKVSRKCINFAKSSAAFSSNTRGEDIVRIFYAMGVKKRDKGELYLGLPSEVGLKKTDVFAFVKDRVWKKISSWNKRKLFRIGKEVLMKVVGQSIPTYVLSIFLLAKAVGEDIERMFNKFWSCNGRGGKRWKSWCRLCASKSRGGLGFRSIHNFNLALLRKQVLRILSNPSSLVANYLKQRTLKRVILCLQVYEKIPAMCEEAFWLLRISK